MTTTLEDLSLPRAVLVTGTGGGVGTTTATAALAAALTARGSDVGVVKPVQTGREPGENGDADVVAELAGVRTQEWHRLREPLTPDVAVQREGGSLPPVVAHAKRVAGSEDGMVLVEGTGGLLVRLDERGGTLADLGAALRYLGVSTGVVVVASADLDALNAVALTAEALTARSLPLLGVVIGDWPNEPGQAALCVLEQLPVVAGAPLLGVLPHGVGSLAPQEFRSGTPGWMTPDSWATMSA